MTMDSYERRERMWPTTDYRRRRVMTNGNEVVAVGTVSFSPFLAPGALQIELIVDEAMRAQGIGTQLLSVLVRDSCCAGALRLNASVRDDFPEVVEWAERRDFIRQGRRFESRLDLASQSQAPAGIALAGSLDDGIAITNMTEQTDWNRLFQVFSKLLQDAPDMAGVPPWTVERCRDVLQSNPNARPDWIVIASYEEAWVGLSILHRMGDDAYNFFTGVERGFRGRGIAQCLKTYIIERARQHGTAGIRTNNLDRNATMLAINRKLGFVEEPGFWELSKVIQR